MSRGLLYALSFVGAMADVPLRELTTMLVLLKKIKGEVLEDRQGYRIVQ